MGNKVFITTIIYVNYSNKSKVLETDRKKI